MSIEVSVTHPDLKARRRLLEDACFAVHGEVVQVGLYSFPDQEAADYFHGGVLVYLKDAVIVKGNIDDLIPPDEKLGLSDVGEYVAEEVKRRRNL